MRRKKIRLPRLSRRGKLLCNLGAALFLVLVSWVLAGCPAWTQAGALRTLERTLLLEPGTVRYQEDGVWRRDGATVLVTGENYAYQANLYTVNLFWHEASRSLEYAALDQGPVLFQWTEENYDGQVERGTWLCPNPPKGAQRAELTVSLDYEMNGGLVRQGTRQVRDYEKGTAVLQAQGVLEDSGLLRLDIASENDREAVLLQELFFGSGYELTEDGERQRNCALTRSEAQLEFFDGHGGSMGKQSAVFPMGNGW